MARYTGPKSKIARRFKDPIFGPDKALDRRSYGPGQHGPNKRRGKQSEYAIQLSEKQKAKYTYGILERQFSNLFEKASRMKGITGEVLLQLCEANLTLMAFGSSAPEIILSVVEALKDMGEPAGDLGPSTIVGSAAFNLLVISALSIYAVGEDVKKIDGYGVFMITSFFSVFAYVWMYYCL